MVALNHVTSKHTVKVDKHAAVKIEMGYNFVINVGKFTSLYYF